MRRESRSFVEPVTKTTSAATAITRAVPGAPPAANVSNPLNRKDSNMTTPDETTTPAGTGPENPAPEAAVVAPPGFTQLWEEADRQSLQRVYAATQKALQNPRRGGVLVTQNQFGIVTAAVQSPAVPSGQLVMEIKNIPGLTKPTGLTPASDDVSIPAEAQKVSPSPEGIVEEDGDGTA